MSSTLSGLLSRVDRRDEKDHKASSCWKFQSGKMLSRIVSTVIHRRYRFEFHWSVALTRKILGLAPRGEVS